MKVYYIEDNQIHSGNVIDIEISQGGYQFSIDSYGGCEGHYRISSDQFEYFVFLNKEEALQALRKRNQ